MVENSLTREGDNLDGACNANMMIMTIWKNIRQEKKCFDK